jgi:hypothetical protein
MSELSEEEQSLRDEILDVRSKAKAIYRVAERIIESAPVCTHTKIAKCDYESARCSICDKRFTGWWCDDSPDKVCHYFTSHDGKVELRNGDEVDTPEGYDGDRDDQSYDWCIYCGDPEERK